jgi:hypothetical protein
MDAVLPADSYSFKSSAFLETGSKVIIYDDCFYNLMCIGEIDISQCSAEQYLSWVK